MIAASLPALTVGRLLGTWSVDPALIVLLLGVAALYLLGVSRVRRGWPRARSASFLAGLAIVATALLSGVDIYADELLSVHMAQHMLLLMVAPVLLASGAPVRLALAAGGRRGRRAIALLLHHRAVRLATRPAFGATVFCAVMLVTHFTGVFELSLRNRPVHAFEHAAFLAAGLLCFVPLIAADPLPRPPRALARFCWLMLVMSAMVVVGAVLSFDDSIRYSHYLAPARALHTSALADQQLAGVVMWFGGGVLGAVLTLVVVTRALLAEERRQRRRDRHATSDATVARRPAGMMAP
jgi:putative membrane protein